MAAPEPLLGRHGHPAKIAVLRANGLGDLVFILPALSALRRAHPDAEVVLLGLDWHRDFLTGRSPLIDRVVAVPPILGDGPDPDEERTERFFAAMRDERFDLALQLHGGGRHSNPFVRRLGARLTAGLRDLDAVALDRWVPYAYYQNEILRYLEVVGLVGAHPVTLEPRLEVLPGDLAEAALAVAPAARPLAVLHPGATDARRQWPPEHFAAVAAALHARGLEVAVVGTEDEADLIGHVVTSAGGGVHDLAGRLSLGGLAGLLSRSAVVVANDSGPLHLARAVGAATVGIYWCGNLINAGPMTRSRHRPAIAWRLECPACGVNCIRAGCDHRRSFVADVRVDEVLASSLDLLSPTGPSGNGSVAPGVADLVADAVDPAGAAGHLHDQVVGLGSQPAAEHRHAVADLDR